MKNWILPILALSFTGLAACGGAPKESAEPKQEPSAAAAQPIRQYLVEEEQKVARDLDALVQMIADGAPSEQLVREVNAVVGFVRELKQVVDRIPVRALNVSQTIEMRGGCGVVQTKDLAGLQGLPWTLTFARAWLMQIGYSAPVSRAGTWNEGIVTVASGVRRVLTVDRSVAYGHLDANNPRGSIWDPQVSSRLEFPLMIMSNTPVVTATFSTQGGCEYQEWFLDLEVKRMHPSVEAPFVKWQNQAERLMALLEGIRSSPARASALELRRAVSDLHDAFIAIP